MCKIQGVDDLPRNLYLKHRLLLKKKKTRRASYLLNLFSKLHDTAEFRDYPGEPVETSSDVALAVARDTCLLGTLNKPCIWFWFEDQHGIFGNAYRMTDKKLILRNDEYAGFYVRAQRIFTGKNVAVSLSEEELGNWLDPSVMTDSNTGAQRCRGYGSGWKMIQSGLPVS